MNTSADPASEPVALNFADPATYMGGDQDPHLAARLRYSGLRGTA